MDGGRTRRLVDASLGRPVFCCRNLFAGLLAWWLTGCLCAGVSPGALSRERVGSGALEP